MPFEYSCEKFNRYSPCGGLLIADETELISSSPYLHTFEDVASAEKYCVISDSVGSQMPSVKIGNEFLVGTSRYVYSFDTASKEIIYKKSLPAPCMELLAESSKLLVICDTAALLISLEEKRTLSEFVFDDVITDYKLQDGSITVYFFEGGEHKIAF